MIITFNPQWSIGNKELMIDNPLDSPFDTFRIQMILKILDNCGRYIYLNKATQERFGQILDSIKKLAHNNLEHDDRAFKIIIF